MNIEIDQTWKRIGISVSGGADSALLAYLICSQTNANIYLTTQVRMWKTRPWQSYVAIEAVEWLRKRFPSRITHIQGFIPPELEEPVSPLILDEYGKLKPGNRIILRAHNEFVVHQYKLDAWFNGVNKNPPIDIPGALAERKEGALPLHMKHMGIDVCHPFTHTTKDAIIKQYYHNDIRDLLDLTRSCEGEFSGLDYTTYIPHQKVPTCKECFWCIEREWAIEQNR